MKIQISVRISTKEEILCMTRLIWGGPLADKELRLWEDRNPFVIEIEKKLNFRYYFCFLTSFCDI